MVLDFTVFHKYRFGISIKFAIYIMFDITSKSTLSHFRSRTLEILEANIFFDKFFKIVWSIYYIYIIYHIIYYIYYEPKYQNSNFKHIKMIKNWKFSRFHTNYVVLQKIDQFLEFDISVAVEISLCAVQQVCKFPSIWTCLFIDYHKHSNYLILKTWLRFFIMNITMNPFVVPTYIFQKSIFPVRLRFIRKFLVGEIQVSKLGNITEDQIIA